MGALILALGLAACGRKGGLDLPPSAAIAGQEAAEAPAPASDTISSGLSVSARGSRKMPVVPSPKRSLPIDVLLD